MFVFKSSYENFKKRTGVSMLNTEFRLPYNERNDIYGYY